MTAAMTGAACTRCQTALEDGDLRCAICALPVPATDAAAHPGDGAPRAQILRCRECGAALAFFAIPVAAAILLFIINIIGLGLGPTVVGMLADLLAPRFGVESLRYALLVCSLDQSQKVGKAVQELEKRGEKNLL